MATEAAHGLLLFLDCDGGMIRQDFIATYLKHKTDKTIISGGREYARIRPTDDRYVLHWSYGSTKESRPLEERQAHPLRYFHSNNFLVERHTFLGVTFDETITSYGYEDLLFAQDAVTKGVTVRHIDNPVEHLDLQTNEVFLDKARMAIDNLIDLQKRGLNVETNLVGGYIKLKSLFLLKPFSIYYKMKEKAILENLRSTHPKLRNLDIYKLYYYMTSRHKKAPNK